MTTTRRLFTALTVAAALVLAGGAAAATADELTTRDPGIPSDTGDPDRDPRCGVDYDCYPVGPQDPTGCPDNALRSARGYCPDEAPEEHLGGGPGLVEENAPTPEVTIAPATEIEPAPAPDTLPVTGPEDSPLLAALALVALAGGALLVWTGRR